MLKYEEKELQNQTNQLYQVNIYNKIMENLKEWHKNYYYGLLEKWNVSSYQIAWLSWFKGIAFGVIIMLLASCSTYQLAPKDECCETEVVYLEDVKSGTTVFSTLDFKTIKLDFRPGFYRSSDSYWYHNYGYMGSRPLWMDYGFYHGNLYSYYSPYYSSFYRPWNYWDYYMRPWMPSNNWYQGPFNNQGYNVAYNSSRRSSLTESNRMSIENKIAFGKIGNSRLVTNTPVVNTKPVIVNKPVVNNSKPVWNNNNKPIIRNNNNRPSYNNSRPSFNNNSKPSFNNNSKPNNNSRSTISVKSRGGKNN